MAPRMRISNTRLAGNIHGLDTKATASSFTELGANLAPAIAPKSTAGFFGRMWTKVTGRGAGKLTSMGTKLEETAFGSGAATVTKGMVVGTVASAAVSGVTATIRHRRDMKQLVLEYRPEVAAMLGIREDEVGTKELRRAAKRLPALEQAVRLADLQAKLAVPNGAISAGASLAGGAIGGAIGLPTTGPGGVVTMIGGTIIAGQASDYVLRKIESKALNMREGQLATDAIQAITAKQQAGQAVNVADVFAVHVAQDKRLDARIQARYGKRFAELDSQAKLSAMLDSPDKAKKSQAEAAVISSGEARAQELVFARVKTVKGVRLRSPESKLDKAAEQLMKSGELPDLAPAGRQNIGKWTSMVNAEHRGPRHR